MTRRWPGATARAALWLLTLLATLSPVIVTTAAPGRACAADLEFIEIRTGAAATDARLPVVIAVHGLGDRPESFGRLFDGFDVAARIVLPRGPMAWGPGYSWFPMPGPDPESYGRFLAGLSAAADRLAELAAELVDESSAAAPVVITGFSQGAMASFAVAALHPQAVIASLPVSGLLPEAIAPAPSSTERSDSAEPRKPRVMAFHGDADRRVPAAGAELAVERLKNAGYDAQIRRYAGVGHGIPAPVRRDLLAAIATAVSAKSVAGSAARRDP